MKYLKYIGLFCMICGIFSYFFYQSGKNFITLKYIKRNIVQHPEYLPDSNVAKISSSGFTNIQADLYWLDSIQYIGSNVIESEYKKYLYEMLYLITDLNPYFEHPYEIGELLLPSYNKRYETLSEEEQEKNINNAIKLGEKGIANFCDMQKIEAINKENNLDALKTNPLYKNPCKGFGVAYNLAYLYFFYKHDELTAAKYYKVTYANDNAPAGAKRLAAIMVGKGGERKKAFFMFVDMARELGKNDEYCTKIAGIFDTIGRNSFLENSETQQASIIKKIDTDRKQLIINNPNKGGIDCVEYINKATRELNMYYIEEANKKFKEATGNNAKDAKELFETGYISYFPKDFQQDETAEIIYFYNEKIDNFDYKMGRYE